LLPYGIVRYHGAPADLRDIPLGTMMHVRAFLPPDPKTSSVPVLPVDSKSKDAGHYRGTGIFPAENHILLLEDEPSHCLRERLVWNLHEVELKNGEGTIAATRAPKEVSWWAACTAWGHLEAGAWGWFERCFHPSSHL
jgi:hypothetical protein